MRNQLALFAATIVIGSMVAAALRGEPGAQAPQQPMGFFVTSVGPGDGANLGGLEGADKHCQALAMAAGAGNRTWRAYLSTTGMGGGQTGVNARDRIGNGPWYNARGQIIAQNVADLHGDVQRDRNQINKDYALTEKGERINGRGDNPNQHDILTGSDSHGRSLSGNPTATTCSNWTSNAANTAPRGQPSTAAAAVGHHDRNGGNNTSWNAAHMSNGCGQQNLVATGGAGLLYCFAIN
ncbi:MAG: hypothetical protein HY646_14985 [Acidobacteria bacterium]|nr:hypothetical protein [Acidobacteriota bacterium]